LQEALLPPILPRISTIAGCNKPLLPSLVPFPRVKHECSRRLCSLSYDRECHVVHARELQYLQFIISTRHQDLLSDRKADPRKAIDGVVYQDETRDAAGVFLQGSLPLGRKEHMNHHDRCALRPLTSVVKQQPASSPMGNVYNQVLEVRNFDYNSGPLLRRTTTQYQNSTTYTSRHIFSLPLTVEVFAGDGLRVSRTDYQYDGQTLTARPDVVQHYQAYNPHADAEGHCALEPDWSDPDCSSPCGPDLMGCDGICQQIFVCPYDPRQTPAATSPKSPPTPMPPRSRPRHLLWKLGATT